MENFHATTIIAVKKKNEVAVAGDGQVTLGSNITKHHAKKVRKIFNDKIIVGFAGSAADALTLTEKLEKKLDQYKGNLIRSSVELAREWRSDKYLRRLEAMMIAVDSQNIFLLSGTGDLIEPDEGIVGIGSGGVIAHAAALALLHNTKLSAKKIAEAAINVTSSLCVYTNNNITLESL